MLDSTDKGWCKFIDVKFFHEALIMDNRFPQICFKMVIKMPVLCV